MNTKECPKCKRIQKITSFMGKEICVWCRGNKVTKFMTAKIAVQKTIPRKEKV